MPRLRSEDKPEPQESLQQALEKAQAGYTALNPLSLHAHNEACRHMPGGNTRTVLHSSPFPLTFKSGSGATLTSLDGHTYTDFLGEYTAGIYGHDNSHIRAAVMEALSNGVNLGGNNVYEKQLAKIVCERFSPTMELVRFTNSGTEANMCAVAAATAFTSRTKILVFSNAYHGSTIGFAAGAASMNLPHDWIIAPYNDVGKTRQLLSELAPASLAAILVEPMLGSGGGIPGSMEFLQYLREAATQHRALLIFDEVMTSRLSYRGLGHKLGIHPDLMTLGKWVGGGMSFGAFGGRRDVMKMFDPRVGKLRHAGTFNNNVVSMAAGCAGCRLLDEETIDKLNETGNSLKGIVNDRLRVHGLYYPENSGLERQLVTNGAPGSIKDSDAQSQKMWISGIGSILVVHFAGLEMDQLQELFFHHMLQKDIYIAQRGFMALSIEITQQDVQKFVQAVEIFLEKYKHLLSG